MSVNSIGAYSTQTAAAAAAAAAATNNSSGTGSATPQISQSDFLSLIVAQLKNQDPTQPTDPNQFVQELASLSEVSGINGMESSVGSLSGSLQSAQLLSGTNLIGREVLAAGTTATVPAGGTVTGAVAPPAGATGVVVQVTDASGQLVRTFQVAPQAGLTPFTWDGRTNSGAAAPPGTYTFTAAAVTGGKATSLSPYLDRKVNSVTIDPSTNTLALNTDSGTIGLGDVVQVN